ncbi:hypothetical protein V8C86DRAFT_2461482 [Haematococcus lacustris]
MVRSRFKGLEAATTTTTTTMTTLAAPTSQWVGEQGRPSAACPPAAARHLDTLAAVTPELRQAFSSPLSGSGPTLAVVMAREAGVGAATSSASCRVVLTDSALVYNFYHPSSGKIKMVMQYRDIDMACLDCRTHELRFHVAQPLNYFAADYDHTQWPSSAGSREGAAVLRLVLASGKDCKALAVVLRARLPCLSVTGPG